MESSISKADIGVLYALHHTALQIVTDQEWLGVIGEVRKAGGIRNVDGYARFVLEQATQQIVLEKAAQQAKQTFGGNRSAAGQYAANQRWGARAAAAGGAPPNPPNAGRIAAEARWGGAKDKAKVSDGAVATSNPAGAGEAMNMEKINGALQDALVGSRSVEERMAIAGANKDLAASRKADVNGNSFDAWNSAASAEFAVRPHAQARGAKAPIKRLHGMLERLVLDMTDAFYAERAA